MCEAGDSCASLPNLCSSRGRQPWRREAEEERGLGGARGADDALRAFVGAKEEHGAGRRAQRGDAQPVVDAAEAARLDEAARRLQPRLDRVERVQRDVHGGTGDCSGHQRTLERWLSSRGAHREPLELEALHCAGAPLTAASCLALAAPQPASCWLRAAPAQEPAAATPTALVGEAARKVVFARLLRMRAEPLQPRSGRNASGGTGASLRTMVRGDDGAYKRALNPSRLLRVAGFS